MRTYHALDQNGKQLFIGDTVFRNAKSNYQISDSDPPDQKFYIVTDIQPDYVPLAGHHYVRKDMPDGGLCSFISVRDCTEEWLSHGSWHGFNFIFSCRIEE